MIDVDGCETREELPRVYRNIAGYTSRMNPADFILTLPLVRGSPPENIKREILGFIRAPFHRSPVREEQYLVVIVRIASSYSPYFSIVCWLVIIFVASCIDSSYSSLFLFVLSWILVEPISTFPTYIALN